MSAIHPTAVVAPGAELGAEVEIGPYCVVGPHVRIGDGARLISHVNVDGHTTLGARCTLYPFASIGTLTQDMKYRGGAPRVEIGEGTTIREYVTVNTATNDGDATRVGARCLLMATSHVAHDCLLGDEVIVANFAALAGHVIVEDRAIIGGLTGIHQFVRIGTMAIVGGATRVVKDVPPYMMAEGNPARLPSINLIGLRRRGVPPDVCRDLRAAHRILCRAGLNVGQAVEMIRRELAGPEIDRLTAFIVGAKRGIIR